MAGSRNPGPQIAVGTASEMNDGTMVRAPSPIPSAVGHHPVSHQLKHRPIVYHCLQKSHRGLPTLRLGIADKSVRWLQILLNDHNASPRLKVDGYFGPKTRTAVIDFQRSSSLTPDAVVGMHTWLKLLVPEVASTQPKPFEGSTSAVAPASPPPIVTQTTSPDQVADWSLVRRFEEVLTLAPKHMAPELAAQFRAMLTPTNVALIVGTLAAWAVSHAFGVGEIVEIVLMAAGTIFLGLAAFTAGQDIGECLVITIDAETRADLDKAADYLARAVAILAGGAQLPDFGNCGALQCRA